jgi:hypothetical protein
MKNLIDLAILLQNTLISQATDDKLETGDYVELRSIFIKNSITEKLLPDYIKKCRGLNEFWQFIKYKYAHYQERRIFIWDSLSSLLEYLEKSENTPSDVIITERLNHFGMEYVKEFWDKALERRIKDPEGAITAARTLIETVCKHILDSLNINYDEKSDLPDLYKMTAKNLNLSPENHQEVIFKQILSGCISVINGLGSLRNKISDAHGKSIKSVKPSERHASLVVNLSGSMAMFLIETYNKTISNK